jgi:uncharacterized membrane protein
MLPFYTFIMVSAGLEVLEVLMRWAHIASAVALIGGFTFARVVVAPSMAETPAEERAESWRTLISRFRPLIYAAIAGLIVSGVYQIMRRPGHTPLYHAVLGLKLLLAAHVFAAVLLVARSAAGKIGAKLVSRMTGIVAFGFTILLIAAFLRRIF